MLYAIELYLDEATDHVVRRIWDAFLREGIPCELPKLQARPHVSLTCYERIDLPVFREKLARFAEIHAALPISFSHVGVFPKGIVFLAPTSTCELLDYHQTCLDAFAAFEADSFALYLPGSWVPHCTLGMYLEPEHIPRAVEIAAGYTLPIDGRIERIALVEFTPTLELAAFDLK